MGLLFCPNHDMDSFETIKDINLFGRKLLLKSLYTKQTINEPEITSNLKAADFRALRDLNLLLQESDFIEDLWEEELDSGESEEEGGEPINYTAKKFKKKSRKFPPLNQNPAIALFVRQITREIEELVKQTTKNNLSPEHRHALKIIRNDMNITIKASDRGGNIVLMDNAKYERMCLNILNNTKCYKKISPALVDKFNQEFLCLIDESLNQGAINRDTWDFIRTRHHCLPTFYALPKVH